MSGLVDLLRGASTVCSSGSATWQQCTCTAISTGQVDLLRVLCTICSQLASKAVKGGNTVRSAVKGTLSTHQLQPACSSIDCHEPAMHWHCQTREQAELLTFCRMSEAAQAVILQAAVQSGVPALHS